MAHQATVIRIMIASPSDVSAERDVVRAVIYEWNDVQPADAGVLLNPVGWETHSSPELGAPAQQLINERVLKDCDLLVGLFWTRVGTPTSTSISGSVEEIERHLDAGKPAMIYFSLVAVPPSLISNAQFDELARFQTWCRSKGIVWTFKNATDLREQFSRHLQIALNQNPLLKGFASTQANSVGIGIASVTIAPPGSSLSAESKHLLVAAASDPFGIIVKSRTLKGQRIEVAGIIVGRQDTHREKMAAEDALSQLIDQNLVIPRGSGGAVFEVTKSGYLLSDQLRIGTLPPPSFRIETTASVSPSLTPEASSLLAAVAKDAAGVLQRVKRTMGTVVRVSGKDFIPDDSPRTAATWSAAVDELVSKGFLESRGDPVSYHITKLGFDAADGLS